MSKINCLQPYELNFSKGMKTAEVKQVGYENHSDHTFWYKLNMKDGDKFSYAFKSLDHDNYDLYLYQYDGTNFCRSLIQNNLELISFEESMSLKVKKDQTYYLGILPLFPGRCGFVFDFTFGESTLTLKTIDNRGVCDSEEDEEKIEPVKEADLVVVTGEVLDLKTNNRISAGLLFLDPFSNHEMYSNSTADGFIVKLNKDGDYKLKISAFGYEDKIVALSAYEGEMYTYKLEASEQKEYVLNEVYFYPNTYALKEDSKIELESVYSFMFNHPNMGVQIIGHTNGDKYVKAGKLVNKKGEEWNFSGSARELSLRRALKIKDYLEEKGLDVSNVEAKGLGGDEMMVEDPASMKEAMQNIRVEIKIVSN